MVGLKHDYCSSHALSPWIYFLMDTPLFMSSSSLLLFSSFSGAILSSKSQSDKDLEDRRNEARKIIHAFHKAQDKMDDFEVRMERTQL